jgi:hypothetical protein
MNKSETTILGSGGGEELTLEEGWKRFEERKAKVFARARLRAQAKSRGVAMAVDAQTAENARARPESIRIATRDESGATRLSAPRRWAVDVGGSSAVGWGLGTERGARNRRPLVPPREQRCASPPSLQPARRPED